MDGKYILDGVLPVLCEDLLTWMLWRETANCRVAETWITRKLPQP